MNFIHHISSGVRLSRRIITRLCDTKASLSLTFLFYRLTNHDAIRLEISNLLITANLVIESTSVIQLTCIHTSTYAILDKLFDAQEDERPEG